MSGAAAAEAKATVPASSARWGARYSGSQGFEVIEPSGASHLLMAWDGFLDAEFGGFLERLRDFAGEAVAGCEGFRVTVPERFYNLPGRAPGGGVNAIVVESPKGRVLELQAHYRPAPDSLVSALRAMTGAQEEHDDGEGRQPRLEPVPAGERLAQDEQPGELDAAVDEGGEGVEARAERQRGQARRPVERPRPRRRLRADVPMNGVIPEL